MKQQDITNVINASNAVIDTLIIDHNCGWFDGGCYTFAKAVSEYFPSTCLYHISRKGGVCDHAVVFIPSINKYLDADGAQTKNELMIKMREIEMTNVSVCAPLHNIEDHPIYEDIKKLFIRELRKGDTAQTLPSA